MNRRFVFRARFERALFAGGALLCYATALVLTPSDVRSQAAPPPAAATDKALVRDAPIAPVAPDRDAFEPRVAGADDAPAQGVRILPSAPAAAPRSAALQTVRPGAGTRVTAIVTGRTPSAIIEIDGVPQALGLGDRVAGARITAISEAAVDLDNGTHLELVAAGSAP